jgi:hypothetical protein
MAKKKISKKVNDMRVRSAPTPVEARPDDLASDMLRGAGAISQFLYGTPKYRQRIYKNAGDWPLFYEGALICARRSKLREIIAEREASGRTAAA